MRRFLLLTMMCFLAFCGNLKAQDTIQVGTKINTDAQIPMHTWYKYSYSQQIYTAEEINHAAGFISEIVFFTNNTKINRDVTIYMINTDKESFSSKSDWVYVDNDAIVYEGSITTNTDMNVILTNNFEYTGGNILICVQDKTGIEISSTSFDIMTTEVNNTCYICSDNALITPENVGTRNEMTWDAVTRKNVLRLIFEEVQEAVEGAPATPTNLTVMNVSQNEVTLAWNKVADATNYNIYSEDTLVANVTDTTYTVTGLEAETKYLYKVSALNDDKLESLPTANVSVTTLRNPEIIVTPANISLGEIVLGEFWSENRNTLAASVECIETEITNIELKDGSLFLLKDVNLEAEPVTFTLDYKEDALSLGDKNDTLLFTCTHGVEKVAVSAVVYTPETPDVFERAEEITFSGSSFSATPEFDKLHDNYNLPKEKTAGNTPDAVYSFELDKTQSVTVDVTGTNGIYAIYKAEEFETNGPKADNNYAGESGAPSTFFYDFSEENVLDNFTLIDKDGDGYNWKISEANGFNGKIIASSSWLRENGAPKVLTPDNYIITKEKYAIKNTSKLSFKYQTTDGAENFGVEISTDGINFESIWSQKGKFSLSEAEIDLSKYEGQELYIAIHHYDCTNGYDTYVDDFRLSNNDGDFVTFPAGKYYLVAAAEDAFTVNVAVGANPADLPAAPQNLKVDNVTATSVTLSWDAVAEAQSYSVYQGTKLVADKIEATTYTVENLEAYTEYAFSVRSFDGEYTSFSSVEVKATTNDFVIETPTNVAVTGLDAYSVKISWDKVEHATSYNVYQNDKKIASELTATMFTVENLVPETEYCFVVSAVRRDMEKKAEAACGKTLAIDFTATDLASTFLFDFNDQSLEGLRTIDADDDGNNWKIGNEGQGYNETYGARSDSYYGEDLDPDNYLVTKVPFMIDSTSKVTLNARIGYEMEMYAGEHYAVVVSENAKDWTVVFEETLNTIDWTNTSVSLEAYAGKAVLVGVRHYNCKHTNRSFVLVDNFALTKDDNTTPEEPGDDVNPDDPIVPENPTDTIVPTPSDSLTLAAPVVTATATSDSTIVLTWNAVEGATSYNIYQATDIVAIATAVKDTTYTVSGLKAETEYTFSVTAVNDTIESAKSADVKATTLKAQGIEELSAAISIYPNPVQNELFIATEVNVKEIAIYDVYGRKTKVYGLQTTDFVHSIDVADLNSGIYFVKVVTNNGEIVKRFVKK